MTELAAIDWRRSPHFFLGIGSAGDPIPIYPPEDFNGTPALYTARTKQAMKAIPDWELLTCFLRGPDLVFAEHERTWFRERWDRLVRLRQQARKVARDGSRLQFDRLVTCIRFRWRVLVQRSIGLRLQGGKVAPWR